MAKERKETESLGKYMQGSTNIYSINEAENCTGGTEEQLTQDTGGFLQSIADTRLAQKITISNRIVDSLTFKIREVTTPTGNITFAIRKVSDDSVIDSNTMNSATLTGTYTDYTLSLTSGTVINEEVYVSCEFSGTGAIRVGYENSDVKAGENLYQYDSGWTSQAARDLYYIVAFDDKPLNM